MTFQVPQFIELEDKIVGPLTLKQFGFIAAAFLITWGFFYLFQFWLWFFISALIWGIAIGLAFIKVSGRPFLTFLYSALVFYWHPRVFLWQHEIPAPVKISTPEIREFPTPAPGRPSPKRLAIPKLEFKVPTITVTKKPALPENKITLGANLKSISEKLMTTKSAIPKREKPFLWFRHGEQERYETIRKFTGERISAKRVDYR